MSFHNISDDVIEVTTNDQNRDFRIQNLNTEFYKKVWPAFILWVAIAIIGVIGNISLFLVLWRGKQKHPLRKHMMFLAVVDLGGCLILVPAEIFRYNNNFSDGLDVFYKIKCSLNVLYMTCSCFVLVSIAIDRHGALNNPLAARQTFENLTWWTIFRRVFYAISVPILSIPPLFLCGASPTVKNDTVGNITVYVNGLDERFRGTIWGSIYKYSASGVHLFLSVVLIVLYIKIAIKVRENYRNSKKTSITSIRYTENGKLDPSTNPRRVTPKVKIYFIVTSVFISCYFLYIGLTFVRSDRLPASLLLVYTIFFKLYYIHSITMPILCFKMDKGLRTYFLTVIFCRGRQRKVSLATVASSSLRSASV